MKEIIKIAIHENPLFVLLLGLCSTLAVSTTFENAYLLGISVLIVLTLSNCIVSLVKKWIGKSVEVPALILIIGTLVTILEMLLASKIPVLYHTFGIYLSLIVVNCIILGRTIQVGMKANVKESLKDGLGVGLGFLTSISLVGLIREILGSGTITLIQNTKELFHTTCVLHLPQNLYYPLDFFITPAGAFITVGLLLGIIQTIRRNHHETH